VCELVSVVLEMMEAYIAKESASPKEISTNLVDMVLYSRTGRFVLLAEELPVRFQPLSRKEAIETMTHIVHRAIRKKCNSSAVVKKRPRSKASAASSTPLSAAAPKKVRLDPKSKSARPMKECSPAKAVEEPVRDNIVTANDCDVFVGRYPNHPGNQKFRGKWNSCSAASCYQSVKCTLLMMSFYQFALHRTFVREPGPI
jgi:hypothetical protein